MPKTSEQLKQEYIDSLDSFIAKNPKVGQLDTSKFRDFLIGLVGHESSYNPTARQGSYFGWYQTNKQDTDPYKQHMNAFNHLNSLFRETITKDDVIKARELGINDSALMLKYWNQGNRVNNYIWNNKDSADGLGTLISNYGSDLTMPLDVYGYAMDNLYGDYTVKKGDNWFNIQKRVRIPGRDYATGGKDLWTMQKLSGVPFGSLKIGQSFNFGPEKIKLRRLPDNLLPVGNPELLNNQVIDTSAKKGIIVKERPKSEIVRKPLNEMTEDDIRSLVYTSFKYAEGGNLVYKPFMPEKKKNNTSTKKSLEYTPNIEEISKPETFPIEEVKILEPDWSITYAKKSPYTEGVIEYNSSKIDVGNMKELIDLMKEEGISFRITSGRRPGAMTKSGYISYHSPGNALDIVPASGQSWDDLINQMRSSERFITYMHEHNLGVLDERSKEMQARTGATGAHFHIGPDKNAIINFETLIK